MSASTSERWRTRRPWRRAAASSGSASSTAVETISSMPGRRCAGSCPSETSMPSAMSASTADGRAVAARDRRGRGRAARARCPTCRLRRCRAGARSALTCVPRARRSSSRATAAAASGRAQLRMPSRIASSRPGSARSSATRAPQLVAVERGVVDDHRTAGGGEVLRVGPLMVARGMGIGYEQRGQAGRRELPDRAARAAHAEVGGRQHVPEAIGRGEHR